MEETGVAAPRPVLIAARSASRASVTDISYSGRSTFIERVSTYAVGV
jgi:hypothetical protein